MNLERFISATTLLTAIAAMSACSDDNGGTSGEASIIDTTGISEEYFTGGRLGTTFNVTTSCYEQPTPAIQNSGMYASFLRGETFFEKQFVTSDDRQTPRSGLGPAYIRTSCIHCHPGYGHGKRTESFSTDEIGNGYLLVVTDVNDNYVSSLTGMPQTRAVHPYKAPVDESKVQMKWINYTDEFGNTFPDGETYSLIYPEVTIPEDAFTVPMPDEYKVRLEATIGVYGTGLLDAIPDDSIRFEHQKQIDRGYCVGKIGKDVTEVDGTTHPARFTYGLTRGTLQNGPGANAIWNITNVTRSDRSKNYITAAWATAMSQDADVQAELGLDEATIYANLMSTSLESEMTDQDYIDFMIWHRGLAVPAARNLNDEQVQQGRSLFRSIGCTTCHRPSWTTGNDDYKGDPMVEGKLPKYPNQKIWPYTDLLQHKLEMVNDIRTGYCRTTPLWGRGLSQKATGASDHLHDMRARNYIEAIMWHGGDAARSREKFRNLSKDDRDALVAFLEAI